jgi:hypothetical protein
MLVKGNAKMGKDIWLWSIPAGPTCPGKSDLCNARCYAQKGFYNMPNVQKSLMDNYELSKAKTFVKDVVSFVDKKKIQLVRIHGAGDFYGVEYIRKWHSIISKSPNTRFYAYTRSWRIPKLKDALNAMVSDCKNIKMWWSLDVETGYPDVIPPRVKTAYMSIGTEDEPERGTNLVFRDYPLRGIIQKKINDVLVCPPENGITDVTCSKCGFCWRDKLTSAETTQQQTNRLPLKLVG